MDVMLDEHNKKSYAVISVDLVRELLQQSWDKPIVSQPIPPHVRQYDQDSAWVGGDESKTWFEPSGNTRRLRGSTRKPQDTVGAVYDSMVTHGEAMPSNQNPNRPDWEGFGRAIMEVWPDSGIDGEDLQEAAEHYGIIYRAPGGYNPHRHGDEWADIIKPGEPFFVRNYDRGGKR